MKKSRFVLAGLALACVALLSVSLVGCSFANSSSSSSSSTEVSDTGATNEGAIGKYYVSIGDARLGTDDNGNDVAFISVKFSNNDTTAVSFLNALNVTVSQNQVEDPQATVSNDSTYNADNLNSEVQPEGSIILEYPVALQDKTTPLDIEITSSTASGATPVTETIVLS